MDGASDGRRPTKLVLAVVLLFVLAVVLGRLVLHGGAAWVLLALALPVVVAVLGAAFGVRVAFLLGVGFTAAVLGTRWLLQNNPGGWVALLLLPVVGLTALVVGKVLAQLRRRDAPSGIEGGDGADEPGLRDEPAP